MYYSPGFADRYKRIIVFFYWKPNHITNVNIRFGFVILIIANEQLHLDAQPNSSIDNTFVYSNYNLKDASFNWTGSWHAPKPGIHEILLFRAPKTDEHLQKVCCKSIEKVNFKLAVVQGRGLFWGRQRKLYSFWPDTWSSRGGVGGG